MSVARKPRRIGPPEPAATPTVTEVGIDLGVVDEFNMRELIAFDRVTDRALTRLRRGEDVEPDLNFVAAVAWILAKRRDPALTFERVLELPMSEFVALTEAINEEARPKAHSEPS